MGINLISQIFNGLQITDGSVRISKSKCVGYKIPFFTSQCRKIVQFSRDKTRPNEFGSMTARKGDIKPQYYK